METPFLSAAELASIQARDRELARLDGGVGYHDTPSPIDVAARPCFDDVMSDVVAGPRLGEPEPCPSPRSPPPLEGVSQGSEASTLPAVLTPEPREHLPAPETPTKPALFSVEREAKKARNGPQPLPCFGGASLGAPPTFAGLNSRKVEVTQLDADLDSSEELEKVAPYAGLHHHHGGGSTPPWVKALLTGMSSLNQKQDCMQNSFSSLSATVSDHSQKIDRLTKAHQDNDKLHAHTLTRLQALEGEVKALARNARSPSPAPPGGARSPLRGRSPAPLGQRNGREEVPENPADLAVVLGGWKEARRSEIQCEVEGLLRKLGLQVHVSEIVIPFVRSTFARLNLNISSNTSLPEARKLQMNLVAELKSAGLKSEIEGSIGADIWALPHQTTEKRNRIKAIVSTKDFCTLHSKNLQPCPIVEFDWRGRVYIGRFQVLAHVEDDPSFSASDVIYHCDKRGSHTGWLIKVSELASALGRSASEVHELWYQFLESGGVHPPMQSAPSNRFGGDRPPDPAPRRIQ